MKNFIKIQDDRIKANTIKKFKPVGETQLNIYFNTSRDKIQNLIYTFPDRKSRDEIIAELDCIFEV